jgi:acyl carrier protein
MNVDKKKVVIDTLESNVEELKMLPEMMNMTLGELGVDSLDVMLILMEVQEKTGVDIPENQVDELDTPNKIISYLESQ